MSKKVITYVLIFVALVSISTYISINFNSKEKAVSFAIHKDLPELKKADYKLVKIPNSPYILCMTDIPHSIYVFKTSSFLYMNFASISGAEHLYAGDGKGMHFFNDQLIYGFDKDRPKGKAIYVNGEKMRTVYLNKYFKTSKYKMNYKNLVFYYPKKPMKTTKNSLGYTEVTYR
ncbi:hypothetical protein [Gottfriedia acidiceleris]|uniref:Uncharacterized protein n=1 Tax=Gottfriedia acidiceleris TaxID=371036 RepID=A0ABY4JJC1_9BACI|nr:hypothetical protein [Gottfriedia acidiceleris]UPM53572.1 hypothetical protein MY490_17525 [Gottfriedia acidiceleris]